MCRVYKCDVEAHAMAQRVALQLREMAKDRGYDPRGIKVVTKGKACLKARAAAQVAWPEGPVNWARVIQVTPTYDVCVEPTASDTLSFYKI